MRTKQALLALSTAIALIGAVSLAQANEPTDSEGGGFKIGPTGQVLDSGKANQGWSSYGQGWNSYGYVAPAPAPGKVTHKRAR